MPKKLRSLAVRPLRPQPDSRIAWAIVTLAGTRNSRCPCCAGTTDAATNWAGVIEPFGPPATAPSDVGAAGAGAGQVGSELAPRT